MARFIRRWATVAVFASLCLTGCDEEFVCGSDYDCAGTEVCNLETGQCEVFVCEVNDQCPSGQSCQNNACVAAE